jgi:hypothetical protein
MRIRLDDAPYKSNKKDILKFDNIWRITIHFDSDEPTKIFIGSYEYEFPTITPNPYSVMEIRSDDYKWEEDDAE